MKYIIWTYDKCKEKASKYRTLKTGILIENTKIW